MKKRILSILTAIMLLFSFTACGNKGNSAEANTTYTGTVAAISEKSITVSTEDGDVVIALSEETTFGRGFGMGGQKPDNMGEVPGNMEMESMGEMPESMGEVPESMGEMPEGMEVPESMGELPEGMQMPESMGEPPTGAAGADNASVPEKPSEKNVENSNSEESSGEGEGTMSALDNTGMMQLPGGNIGGNKGGNVQNLTYEDIAVDDTVTVVTGEDAAAVSIMISSDEGDFGSMEKTDGMGGNGSMGGPGGTSNGVESYDAAAEFTTDVAENGTNYASTNADENAIHVYEGANVTLEKASITRESDNSTGGDNSSFYGVGAAALVTDGTMTISDSTIKSSANGGAGVFAYGDGTAYVEDTVIDTTEDTSGGIHVAGGGTLYAWDLTVNTEGESSAAIRSDRGSGTMVVDGGSYTSNGVGSPAVYSTADITINNAKLTANGSEASCIEGLNTIRLFDCDLSGNMSDLEQNDSTWNVILYQSMSGDSEVGNSTFEMVGGSLTAHNGGMFYTTNTESTFVLSDVDITYAKDNDFFLKCTGNSNQRGWGTAGNNGADCHFTAIDQAMEGDILWDSISQLDFYVLDNSTFTGAVIQDESNAGDAGEGYAALYIDKNSTWTVTGNSTLSTLHCAGKIVDADGNVVTITGTDGTVYVKGDSSYTITVDSYDNTVDTSAASSVDNWSDFAVERP